MKTLRIKLLLLLTLFAATACRPGVTPELAPRTTFTIPAALLPESISLAVANGIPYVAYTDRESLALVLAAADPAGQPDYLDRITAVPENGGLLGSHFLLGGEQLHLLYLDRQSEETRLLKYVRKDPVTGTSWIDVLPDAGKPVAALLAGRGEVELFLEKDQGLYWQHYPASASPRLLATPFAAGGAASPLSAPAGYPGLRGFTVYDSLSQRLILFWERGGELAAATVARFGRVHQSGIAADGTLQVMAYDPRSLRIVLFETRDPASGFRAQPVTLSRGTTSVALVRQAGGTAFLFNEIEAAAVDAHLISLLVPARTGGYRKLVLYRAATPLASFRAVQTADSLYVAFQDGSLRVLRLEIADLPD